jgi:hypothetical protein
MSPMLPILISPFVEELIIYSVYVTRKGCNEMSDYSETWVPGLSYVFYLKVTFSSETSVIMRPITRRHGLENVQIWQNLCDKIKSRTLLLRNISSRSTTQRFLGKLNTVTGSLAVQRR